MTVRWRHGWGRRIGGQVDKVTEVFGIGPRRVFSIGAGSGG